MIRLVVFAAVAAMVYVVVKRYTPEFAAFSELFAVVAVLLFLLPDKRVAAYGFAGLAVALVMFYIGALLLDADQRDTMLQVITLYGLAPALLGNAVAWPLYLRLRKTHPLPQQKTLREEIREAAEKSGGRVVRKAPQEEPAGAARRASPEEDAMLLYGDDGENAG